MLADEYYEELGRNLGIMRSPGFAQYVRKDLPNMDEKLLGRLREDTELHVRGLSSAQRFVLSPQVVEAAWGLTESKKAIRSSRDYLFTPAKHTWIEWSDQSRRLGESNRFGLLLIGKGDGKTPFYIGVGAVIFDLWNGQRWRPAALPILFDFPGEGDIITYPLAGNAAERFVGSVLGDVKPDQIANCDSEQLSYFIAATIAIINTPRLSQVTHHDLTKLNKARLKRNRPALLSWSDVIIRPDSGWVSQSEERRQTGDKRRHHVRTFLRLKRGQVEMVGAHWRGNRDKGYALHRHVVRMTDEQAGAWKGAPLPGPSIIRPGQEIDVGDED